jgi:type II secretory ATPase GspE/PulE/Tfp pilus assembly ATPase PilB-like protein
MNASGSVVFTELDLEGVPAEQAVQWMIEQAAALTASDLFLIANENDVEINIRHLGIIRHLRRVPIEQGRRMIVHVKAMSGIDIAEKRRPQDGRWIYRREDGRALDLRVNSLPTLFGEDIDMRLLDRDSQLRPLNNLGMSRHEEQQALAMLSSPSGLLLVTGPTGSGKTTTLYACLHHLNDGTRKINTIEDPIEYAVEGIRQSQINLKHGVDFPDLLRGVLRQSPDVIMVGEIRDPVTAQTAVRAANSGHLVLATLHAPVAAVAVQSMLNLDVHPHFLSTSLLGVIAQRLVRTLDPETKVAYDVSESPMTFEEVRPWLGPEEGRTIYGPGSPLPTSPDGYSGRTAVFEVLPISSGIRQMISDSGTSREIQAKAIEEGMLEFRRSSLLKVARGITSTEEILRAVPTEYLGIDY